ncbi:MAG: hypothetical protein HC921_21930 [Synechococcaceae cyanobacterium SM2_3_1]|nr:hypothetical protein [Synechococcaceae cyanobacterium SM2_3_1]
MDKFKIADKKEHMKSKHLSQNNNWCIIYSDIEFTQKAQKEIITKIFDTYRKKRRNSPYEWNRNVFPYENPDYSESKKINFPDGFMYFRLQISIEEIDSYDIGDCIEFASSVLTSLWSLQIPSVATCQFEDLLPLKGGYKSKWSCSPPKVDLESEVEK